MTMTHNDLRTRFLEFFEKRDHMILPSAPLVPINDNSTLFTTAGVQPIIPYLKFEKEAPATRLANAHGCRKQNLRTTVLSGYARRKYTTINRKNN